MPFVTRLRQAPWGREDSLVEDRLLDLPAVFEECLTSIVLKLVATANVNKSAPAFLETVKMTALNDLS